MQYPVRAVFGPMPKPACYRKVRVAARSAEEAASQGDVRRARVLLDRAFEAFARQAEKELPGITGHAAAKQPSLGKPLSLAWLDVLPEKGRPARGHYLLASERLAADGWAWLSGRAADVLDAAERDAGAYGGAVLAFIGQLQAGLEEGVDEAGGGA